MNTKPHVICTLIACLLFLTGVTFAQEKTRKPQTLITKQKLIPGTLRVNENQSIKVKGAVFFNVTVCQTNKTLAGELTVRFEEASQELLALLDKKLEKPFLSAITLQNVIADFAKGAECPALRLEFQPVSIALNGVTLQFDKFTLDLKESNQEVYRVLCRYVSCIIHCRQVRRINELLLGFTDN